MKKWHKIQVSFHSKNLIPIKHTWFHLANLYSDKTCTYTNLFLDNAEHSSDGKFESF